MTARRAAVGFVPPPIDEIVSTIVERFRPLRIVPYGSRARGDARPDSDLDLLVVMESDLSPMQRLIAIDEALWPRRWGLDLLAHTPAEIARMRATFGSLIHTIDAEGRLLYERS
ncbi:MAG: nucleotidyltransferase domain-containing protein [Gemmatimonadaceae bacterium]